MDVQAFLQQLYDRSLEQGHLSIQEHITELSDYAVVGKLIADEALRQRDINPSISFKLAELLIFFGEYSGHSLSHALGFKAKGDILNYFEQHQAALGYLDVAGEEFLRLGDEVNWACTRISWIVSCAWLGQVELALQAAERARTLFLLHGESYWACVIDHNTAVIYSQMGQYHKALALYERLLVAYPTLQDSSAVFIESAIAMVEANKARNLSWLGNFELAYSFLNKARERFSALGKTAFIIWMDIVLADLDYILGYYGSALRRYYHSRDRLIQENIDYPVVLAVVMLKMATCLVKLNRIEEAYHLAIEAVAANQRIGVSLTTGQALREYAMILVAANRRKEALAVLDEAYELFAQGNFEHHAALARLQRAELLLLVDALTDAYEQARTLKVYFDAQGLVLYAARASLVMVKALLAHARYAGVEKEPTQHAVMLQEAAALCKQVTMLASRHNFHEEAYQSQHLLGQLALMNGNGERASRHYKIALARIEYILDGLVYDLGPAFLHTIWGVYEDMIALCLQQGHAALALSYLERARSVSLRQYLSKPSLEGGQENLESADATVVSALQARNAALLRIQNQLSFWQEKYHDYSALLERMDTVIDPALDHETIRSELKRCEANLSELFERAQLHEVVVRSSVVARSPGRKERSRLHGYALDVVSLRQKLAADQLLLAYFLYQGKLVIFALTTERLVTYEIPDGMEQLESLLPLVYARLLPEGWSGSQKSQLHIIQRLLQKLYTLLVAPIASLLPPPAGSLTIVPFGPLHSLPFHALHNGSHYLIEDFQISYLPTVSMLKGMDPGQHVNNAGDIPGGQKKNRPLIFGYSGQRRLSQALAEAQSVADMLDGNCYLEEEATIARLSELAVGRPIIHLATHGQSRLDAPNFSSLFLADGQLNTIDAFHLNLQGCELVTLSGCETGLSLSGGGDEQLGLGRAFLAAGAASLIMSLWPVEDSSTNTLMQNFYRHLLRGESRIQALCAAQRDFLEEHASHPTHPYFWAGFRLVGETSALRVIHEPLKRGVSTFM